MTAPRTRRHPPPLPPPPIRLTNTQADHPDIIIGMNIIMIMFRRQLPHRRRQNGILRRHHHHPLHRPLIGIIDGIRLLLLAVTVTK